MLVLAICLGRYGENSSLYSGSFSADDELATTPLYLYVESYKSAACFGLPRLVMGGKDTGKCIFSVISRGNVRRHTLKWSTVPCPLFRRPQPLDTHQNTHLKTNISRHAIHPSIHEK